MMANMLAKGLEKWNPGQPGFAIYKYFLGLRPHAVAEGYKDGERITGDEAIMKWGPAGPDPSGQPQHRSMTTGRNRGEKSAVMGGRNYIVSRW